MKYYESEQSDERLVRNFREGNKEAASQLVFRYKDRIYATVFYWVKDRNLADDLFQEAFLKIFSHLQKNNYVEQGKFLPWALRIAHNLCMDHFRQAKKWVNVVLSDGQDILEFFAGSVDCHEKVIIRGEVINLIQRMIERLPWEQREVVTLRIYGELSFKEIAEISGVSINTALGRMRYALNNLRKMIEEKNLVLR